MIAGSVSDRSYGLHLAESIGGNHAGGITPPGAGFMLFWERAAFRKTAAAIVWTFTPNIAYPGRGRSRLSMMETFINHFYNKIDK